MVTQRQIINRVKEIYLDKPVLYSLIGTVWRMAFAPISLFLVALKLTPELQGFYYLFFSIAGMQAVVEAGFSHTLVQSVSHEMENVKFEAGKLIGNDKNLYNIGETMRMGFLWYTIVALTCLLIIYPIGLLVIGGDHWETRNQWLGPWSCFIVCFALNIFLYPVNFFFEGILQLEKIYKNRLIIQILSSVFFVVALYIGFGLYSIIIFSLVSFVVNLTQLFVPNFRQFSNYIFKKPTKDYIKKTYKWQLKVSAVWCTGYLYWQLPTVIIFSKLGPVISGQYSMTVNVINAIINIGQVFVKTKAALIGELRASRKFQEAFALFRKNSIYSYLIVTAGIGTLLVLWFMFPSFIVWRRMLPFVQSVILFIAFAMTMLTLNQAMFARCSKEEPFFKISMFVNFAFPLVLFGSLLIVPNIWGVLFTFVVIHMIELCWGIGRFKTLYGYWW